MKASLSPFQVVVDPGEPGGHNAVVDSTVPLSVPAGESTAALDLDLEEQPDNALKSSRPLAPVRIGGRLRRGLRFEHFGWSLAPKGTSDAAVRLTEEGKAFYANIAEDTDLLVEPLPEGVETIHMLRSPASPERLDLDVDVPQGGSVRLTGTPLVAEELSLPQSVEVLDKTGHVVATMLPPSAVDAEGAAVPVTLQLSGKTVTLVVEHRDADVAYPIAVDPYVVEDWRYWYKQTGSFDNGDYVDYDYWTQEQLTAGYLVFDQPSGLRIQSYSNGLYANEWGQWNWRAPGSRNGNYPGDGTYLFKADMGNYSHSPSSSCSALQAGIFSDASSRWEPNQVNRARSTGDVLYGGRYLPACGTAELDAYRVICTGQPCDDNGGPGTDGDVGNRAVFTLFAGNGFSAKNASFYVGSALLFRTDRAAPHVTGTGLPATGSWVTESYSGTISADDYGVGMQYVAIAGNSNWTPPQPQVPCQLANGAFRNLTGDRKHGCPTSTSLPYSLTNASEGRVTGSAAAVDIVNRSATVPFDFNVDRSLPGGATSGTALPGGANDLDPNKSYGLTVAATDTGAGVQSVEVLVDNTRIPGGLAARGCTAAAGCSPADWTPPAFAIDTTGRSYGTHTLDVTVTDAVGRAQKLQQKTFRVVDKSAPSLTVSGPLRQPLTPGRDLTVKSADGESGLDKIEIWRVPVGGSIAGVTPLLTQPCTTNCTTEQTASWRLPDDTPTGAWDIVVRSTNKSGISQSTPERWTIEVADLRRTDRSKLGLESWFDYDDVDAGGDSTVYVNAETGNAVWHSTPIVDPGRGLSTVVNLTYNSLDRGGLLGTRLAQLPVIDTAQAAGDPDLGADLLGSAYSEAGVGVSVGVSGPTRINEPLGGVLVAQAVVENNPGLLAGVALPTTPQITLTDADGTKHTFTAAKQSDGTWRWNSPPGLDMHLRRYRSGGTVTSDIPDKWALSRSDGVTSFFDNLGYLRQTKDRNGNALTYSYDRYNALGGSTACQPTDQLGVALPTAATVTKVCAVRLKTVSDANAGKLTFTYRNTAADGTPLNILTAAIPGLTATISKLSGTALPAGRSDLPALLGGKPGRIAKITDSITGREYTFTYDDDSDAPGGADSKGGGHLVKFSEASNKPDAEKRITTLSYETPQSGIRFGQDRELTSVTERVYDAATAAFKDGTSTKLEYGARSSDPVNTKPARKLLRVVKRTGNPRAYTYTSATDGTRTLMTSEVALKAATSTKPADATKTLTDQTLITTHRLDSQGRPTDITDEDNRVTHLAWSPDHKVTAVDRGYNAASPAASSHIEYEYLSANEGGALTYKRDYPDGVGTTARVTHFTYEPRAAFAAPATGGGDTTADAAGYVQDLKSIDKPEAGTGWTVGTDANGNVTSRVDAKGKGVTASYEDSANPGLMTKLVDEQNRTTTFADFDRSGQPRTVVKNAEPADTTVNRAAIDRTWKYKYDGAGNVTSVIDPRGVAASSTGVAYQPYTTSLAYDAFDRLEQVVAPKRSVPKDADPTSTASGAWTKRSFTYDRDGNQLTATDAENKKTSVEFTAADQPLRVTSPFKAGQIRSTGYVYDLADRLIGTVAPKGDSSTAGISQAVDAQLGACTAGSETPQAYLTRYCLSGAGDVLAEVAYDPSQSAVEDRKQTTSKRYDARHNLTGVIDPARNRARDTAAAITATGTDANLRGQYAYDKTDQLLQDIEQPKTSDAYEDGSKPANVVTRYEYDKNGNRIKEHAPNGDDRVTTLKYNRRDQLIGKTDARNRLTCIRRYDDGRVQSITSPRGTAGRQADCFDEAKAFTYFTTKFTYDRAGDVASRSIPFSPTQYAESDDDLSKWKVRWYRNSVGDPDLVIDAKGNRIVSHFYDTGELLDTDRPSWWDADWGTTPGSPDAGSRYTGDTAADVAVSDGGPQLIEREGRSANAAQSDQAPSLPKSLGEGDLGAVGQSPLPGLLPPAGKTAFGYDDEMRLTSVIDARGRARRLHYYDDGAVRDKQWPFKDSDPVTHDFDYDPDGNLTRSTVQEVKGTDVAQTTPLNTQLSYDGFDRITAISEPGSGAKSDDTSPAAETTKYAYDANDNVLTRETPRGVATSPAGDYTFGFTYDSLDRLISETNPADERWQYAYNANSDLTSELSPRGRTAAAAAKEQFRTTFAYTAADELLSQTRKVDDAGTVVPLVETYGYDDDGNQDSITTPGAKNANGDYNDRVTKRVFDGRGMAWKSTVGVSDGQRTTLTEYDPNGNLRRTVNPVGVNETDKVELSPDTGSDSDANLTTASKNATLRQYDANDLLTAVRLPWDDKDSRRFRQLFKRDGDALDRITSVTSPHESDESRAPRTSYSYFDSDWIKSVSDTKLTTNASTTPIQDRAVAYDYDHRGNQTSWEVKPGDTSTDGRLIRRSYWDNDLLRTRTARRTNAGDADPGTRSYNYFYDDNGSLTSFYDRQLARSTEIARDPAERESRVDEIWTGGRDTTYTYDGAGNLANRKTDGQISATDPSQYTGDEARQTDFTYDSLGRETKMTVAKLGATTSRVTTTRWWPSGERYERVKPDGVKDRWFWTTRAEAAKHDRVHGSNTDSISYSYDPNGNRVNDERGTYEYNARDQVTKWTRPDDFPVAAKQGAYTNYTLRADGALLKKEEFRKGGGRILVTSNDYQGDGERLHKVTVEDYGLSNTSPVAGVNLQTTSSQTFEYDPLGSVSKVTANAVDVGTGQPIPPVASPTAVPTPDGCGATDSGATARLATNQTMYSYDCFERQIFAKGQGVDDPAKVDYDGLDRRDKRTVYAADGSSKQRDYSYVGTSEQLARDTDIDGAKRVYDYDSSGGREGQQIDKPAGLNYRAYNLDANGSVVGLENSVGEIPAADRYVYDPYGELEKTSTDVTKTAEQELGGEAQANPFRFQGFYYDSGVKTYDMNARAYRPDYARFLSADVFADAAGDQVLQSDPLTQNRYAFTAGNPVTRVEFDGHKGVVGDNSPDETVVIYQRGGGGKVVHPQSHRSQGLKPQPTSTARYNGALPGAPSKRFEDRQIIGGKPQGGLRVGLDLAWFARRYAAYQSRVQKANSPCLGSSCPGAGAILGDAAETAAMAGGPEGKWSVGATRRAASRLWGALRANKAAEVAGSGPMRGVLEVSERMKSSAAVRNWAGKDPVEYVYDPATKRFAMGRGAGPGSPHEQLARSIDADESGVVGGMVRRDASGLLVTNEQSGHFWQNWTPGVRTQFKRFMRDHGVMVEHGAGH